MSLEVNEARGAMRGLDGAAPSTTGGVRFAAYADEEKIVRAIWKAGDPMSGTRYTSRALGAELYGFLLAVTDGRATSYLYRDVIRRMAREIIAFDWRVSVQAWLYARARRELARHRECAKASSGDSLEPVALPSNSEFHAAFSDLRGRLSPEDREILVLRVDRRFNWWDLALTSLADAAPPDEVRAESLRLRARVRVICTNVTRIAVRRQLSVG